MSALISLDWPSFASGLGFGFAVGVLLVLIVGVTR